MDKVTEANKDQGGATGGQFTPRDDRFFESLHRRHPGGDGSRNKAANASTLDAREVLARMSKGDVNDEVFTGFVSHLFADRPGREDTNMTPERAAAVTRIKDRIIKAVAEELFVHGADRASELILITALSAAVLEYSTVYPDLPAKIVPNIVIGDLLGLGLGRRG